MDPGQVIHDIQMWGGWSWSGWVALGSIGTVGALIIALALGLGVTGLIFKPRLTVTLNPGLPDFCPVETGGSVNLGKQDTFTDEDGNAVQLPVPTLVKASDQYYCRFRVNNLGGWRSVSANDVQVLLSELWNVGVSPAEAVQPFLPVQLAWADIVTGAVLRPEMEVILPILQPQVFRYCNLCHVDRKTHDLLEFNAKPEPNKMLGEWPTKKAHGHYEVDVVLTAANFERRFITFDIDFKGGAWPADNKNFDAMYTAKVVYQGKKRPSHPIRNASNRSPTADNVPRRALRWLSLPVWMLALILVVWIGLGV